MARVEFFRTKSSYDNHILDHYVVYSTPWPMSDLYAELAHALECKIEDFHSVECRWFVITQKEDFFDVVLYKGEIIGTLDRELSEEDVELCRECLKKTVAWFAKAYYEIHTAGGHPVLVLSKFPDEVIMLMIKNNLSIKYERHLVD